MLATIGHRETVLTLLGRYYRPVLCLSGLMGWFLALPLFGPALATLANTRGIAPTATISLFLLGNMAAFFTAYFRPQFVPLPQSGAAICSVLGFTSLLYVMAPGQFWPFLGLVQGLVNVPLVLTWVRWFTLTVPSWERGRVMGWAICLTNLLVFGVIVLGQSSSPAIAVVIAVLPLFFTFRYYGSTFTSREHSPGTPGNPRLLLYLLPLVVVIYFLAGLMYGIIFPRYIVTLPSYEYSHFLAYAFFALVAGLVADHHGRRTMVFFPISLLGIGFLMLPWADGRAALLLTATLMFSAYSFVDVFLWTVLGDIAPSNRVPSIYGLGLGLNLTIILLGFSSFSLMNVLTAVEPLTITLVAIIMLFIILPFLAALPPKMERPPATTVPPQVLGPAEAVVPEPEPEPELHPPVAEEPDMPAVAKRGLLTEREQEIVGLVVTGKPYEEIAQELFISPNTLKTHMRNIYRKEGVKNRSQLVVKIMQEQNS